MKELTKTEIEAMSDVLDGADFLAPDLVEYYNYVLKLDHKIKSKGLNDICIMENPFQKVKRIPYFKQHTKLEMDHLHDLFIKIAKRTGFYEQKEMECKDLMTNLAATNINSIDEKMSIVNLLKNFYHNWLNFYYGMFGKKVLDTWAKEIEDNLDRVYCGIAIWKDSDIAAKNNYPIMDD